MKFVNNWQLFKESKSIKNNSQKNIIQEICISMVLLNNEFLDNILDKGIKGRYLENSDVFLVDLKNLLLSKTRLSLGKFEDKRCVSDNDVYKLNDIFKNIEFSIENDWNKLIDSRTTARNIIDKLIIGEKLTQDKISKIFWIGPNKNEEYNEDVVIETTDGNQYSLFLNKNLSLQKTSSFNKFADDIIPKDIDNLFDEENIKKWDKLTQEWVRILYECSNKEIQMHIEKFIDPKRIDSIGYFDYFNIRHRDPKFKFLGEYIKEFEKNILNFSDLMNLIWKEKEKTISDIDRATKEWSECKTVILNSRILEHLFTKSLKDNNINEIKKLESGFKEASGYVKMKLMKAIVNKIGCLERTIYYLSNNGNVFYQIPKRDFFRKNYNDIDLHFDYHVKFDNKDDQESNNFNLKIKLLNEEIEIIKLDIVIGFSGGEFSSKLSAKFKFEIPDDFNYQLSKFETPEEY